MKIINLLVLVLLLNACHNLPSPNETQEAEYGPFPEGYESISKDYLLANLRDPDTVQIGELGKPKKQWIGDKITGIKYGYLVCIEVNSKNIFNKLTGLRTDALLIRNNEVIQYVKDGELLSGMQLCN